MIEWNREDLDSFLKNHRSGLLYFYTPLCGTCQMASKMLTVMEKMVTLEMGKMNLNFYADLAERFQVESVPCLIFVEDGRTAETMYAFHSVPYLYEKIKEHFS